MERSNSSLRAEVASNPAPALIHVGFVLTGMVTTLLGPVLPALSARWSLDDLHAGSLFTAQFIGSMAGVLFSSKLLPRRGFQNSLALGFGLMSAGVAALGFGTWATGLVSVFCYGTGLGVTIPATNLLVAEANPGRRAAALNLLNLSWGIGAVACPSLTALLQRPGGTSALLFGIAAALGLMTVFLSWASVAHAGNTTRVAQNALPSQGNVWRNRFVPLLGILFFLYVGTENALGGWAASHALRVSATPGVVWVLTPSFFWGALLLGRALAPSALRHVAEARLALAGLLLAAVGVALLLAASALSGVIAGVSLAGLGLASVFPVTVALVSQNFGVRASRVAGPMFALGGLGGATVPWLVGFLSSRFGSLKVGLVVPLISTLAMAAMYLSSLGPHTDDSRQSG